MAYLIASFRKETTIPQFSSMSILECFLGAPSKDITKVTELTHSFITDKGIKIVAFKLHSPLDGDWVRYHELRSVANNTNGISGVRAAIAFNRLETLVGADIPALAQMADVTTMMELFEESVSS